MQEYKVITDSVGAKANKIFYYGQIVDGSNWNPDTLKELVKGKFLEPLKVSEHPATPPDEAPTIPAIDSVTVDELKLKLKLAGYKFDENTGKEKLYKLCINNKLFSNT